MEMIKKKKFILFSLLALALYVVYVVTDPFEVRKKDDKRIANETQKEQVVSSIEADLDGDGFTELIKLISIGDSRVVIEAYDSNNIIVASTPENTSFIEPYSFSVVKLNENSPIEYIKWDNVVGPHQMETVFITMGDGNIMPVYGLDSERNVLYFPFYSSRGDIVVSDLDEDGYVEVIEFADEYPTDSPRLEDEDIEQQTMEIFGEAGEDAITIFSRENNGLGKGRRVIWSLYTFYDKGDFPVFLKFREEDFDVLAGMLVEAGNSVGEESYVKYTDLEQDSIDFNIFVRKFWNSGTEFEFSMD